MLETMFLITTHVYFLLLLDRLPQLQWLRQHRFILLQFWKSEVKSQFEWAKAKVSAKLAPHGGSGTESNFPSTACCRLPASVSQGPFLSLQSQGCALLPSSVAAFSCGQIPFYLPLWGYRWLYLGPMLLIQKNFLISKSLITSPKSLLSHKVTFTNSTI